MTDDKILGLLEPIMHAIAATQAFFAHALCNFAEQPGVDLQGLIDGIRSLEPQRSQAEEDVFRNTYTACKNRVLNDLEAISRARNPLQSP